ncbi:conserved hypothetical protein [Talaromyces stipitatus ATCC 10500]|uniref:DDE-1 domain-containing protein n=1 Tax=Talaromyces stipitatus (strain ATCC 10500 / CBS 375.48 / QM 6759 / NRRL 1006) TaxID=441959 RepID=B8MQX3_TALSN|nr:uncharacterized protein TSTA_053260 [Talaromyces stipitatus ATCC 10500]EED12808.1 conserved hypothetical protein [Talaromyces stipitatus ATCC 10500]
MDNHTAHLTSDFISYCEENKIIPFAFPPHTPHILQPLHGMPFLHYKRIYRRAINEQAHLGGYFYGKVDFLADIARVRAEALTPRTIRKGFSERGLWTLNPDLIVDRLMAKWEGQMGPDLQGFDGNEEEQNIPSSPTNASFSPPTTAYKLQKALPSDMIPGIRRSLKKIFDESLTQAHIMEQQ